MNWNRLKGFTLVEVLIVVAIIAILAAVAYPNYARFIMKGRRADGRELLMRVAAAEEKFYTNRNQYSANLGELGIGNTSEQGHYTLANPVVAAGGQTFVATVTPVGAQATDQCGGLTLNNLGVRGMTNPLPAAESNGRCW